MQGSNQRSFLCDPLGQGPATTDFLSVKKNQSVKKNLELGTPDR
jgi:hypothetical protein